MEGVFRPLLISPVFGGPEGHVVPPNPPSIPNAQGTGNIATRDHEHSQGSIYSWYEAGKTMRKRSYKTKTKYNIKWCNEHSPPHLGIFVRLHRALEVIHGKKVHVHGKLIV